ncbi:MAG TPA: hypothetical protein VK470_17865 [Bacteroidota bacterium]|nr:hypothetical protein [Bacteroidota bacterium]
MMIRKISMIFISATAIFVLWNSSTAQYPRQDSIRRLLPSDTSTMRGMRQDTTIRRLPMDSTRGLYPQDTGMGRGRFNRDTSGVRIWVPEKTQQPDTSSGIH